MEFQLKFKVNQSLFLKDPEGSTIGKAIVAKSIDLIYILVLSSLHLRS